MEAITVEGAAALLGPIQTLGHSDNDVSAVTLLKVSITTVLKSDNMDANDLTTDAQTESVNKHPKSPSNVKKGGRLYITTKQIQQEGTPKQFSPPRKKREQLGQGTGDSLYSSWCQAKDLYL